MRLANLTPRQLETLGLISYGFRSSTLEIKDNHERNTSNHILYEESKHKGLFVDCIYTHDYTPNVLTRDQAKEHAKRSINQIKKDDLFKCSILNYRFSKIYFTIRKDYGLKCTTMQQIYYPQPRTLYNKNSTIMQKLYDKGLLYYIPLYVHSNPHDKHSYYTMLMPVVHPKLGEYLQFDLLEEFLVNDSEINIDLAMRILKSQKVLNDYDLEFDLNDVFNYYINSPLFQQLKPFLKEKLFTELKLNPKRALLGLFGAVNIYEYVTQILETSYDEFTEFAINCLVEKTTNRLWKLSHGLYIEEYLANVLLNEKYRFENGADDNYFNKLHINYEFDKLFNKKLNKRK